MFMEIFPKFITESKSQLLILYLFNNAVSTAVKEMGQSEICCSHSSHQEEYHFLGYEAVLSR
jgi:hypothetical protein